VYAALPPASADRQQAATGPVVSGAIPLSFSAVGGGSPLFTANLTAAGVDVAAVNVWVRRGFGGGCNPAPAELVYEGQPQRVAQWPNAAERLDTAPGFKLTEWDDATAGLTNSSMWVNATSCPFSTWADTANVWVHAFPFYDWADEMYPVTGVLQEAGQLQLIGWNVTGVQQVTGAARFRLVNSADALDEPGEELCCVCVCGGGGKVGGGDAR
jgi:hypothetical protein